MNKNVKNAKKIVLTEFCYNEPDWFQKLAKEIWLKYWTVWQTLNYRWITKRSTMTRYTRAFNRAFWTNYTREELFTEVE